MRHPILLLLAIVSIALSAAAPAGAADSRLQGSYKFTDGGWTYAHLEGTPEQIGFQHGYLLAREIEDNVRVYQAEALHNYNRDWSFFREAGKACCGRTSTRSIGRSYRESRTDFMRKDPRSIFGMLWR